MTDPRSTLLLAAEDISGPAFASQNAKLRELDRAAQNTSKSMIGGFNNVGRAAIGVRNVLGGLGVVLSAQALGNWISTAMKSSQATDEQRAALDAAGAAMTRLNTESQRLAVTIGAELAPKIQHAAEWWRRFLYPTDAEAADERLAEMSKRALELSRALVDFEEGRTAPARGQSQVANMRRELDELMAKMRETRGERDRLLKVESSNAKDPLQMFDLQAIGRQALPEPRNFNREIEKAAAEAAEKRAEQQREQGAREETQRREQLLREVEFVRESTLTVDEVEREAIERRLQILAEANERGLIDQQRFYEISAGVAVAGQQRLTEIERAGMTARQRFQAQSGQQKIATVIGEFAQITAGTAQYNKRLFELNKAAGIANAVVNTALGVSRSLAAYPMPIAAVFAAMHAVAGLAQVQAIRSTTFEGGGGGTTPSFAGSAPVINGQPLSPRASSSRADEEPGRGQVLVSVNVQGSLIGTGGSDDLARQIAALLRDHIDNRDGIIIPQGSRQAKTILDSHTMKVGNQTVTVHR